MAQEGKLEVSVADSANRNECTFDGKKKSNAMTSIFVTSASAKETPIPRLPKAMNRMFDIQQLTCVGLCSIVP
ncbi:hypothetical protein DPMN_185121 [Dreissena polymorpha]|uniref:Uncharacterized protein n=1 Tax=Dreissena polymorpha TaxID=45954 RepID=A0A9D4I716_DREPO|nr:hypothetical protein DPMN_185121 [Dreissena polymorpha]